MKNKICVYAMCKNEEQFVEKWYESMKEADAVVVLDTGSTDNTVEKLRALGATVEVKIIDPWRFDVARNESLKLVPDDCNILISTDLDEVLEPGWAEVLRNNWIEGIHERATYKYTWSHGADGSEKRIFVYDKIHSKNWEWKAPVHELLYNKNTGSNLYTHLESLDLFDSIHLHHYPDMSKSRSSYLPLLELRAEEMEDDYYGLIYLAHEYFYREQYSRSIETLNKVLDNFRNRLNSVEIASCYLFMGDDYRALVELEEKSDSENKYDIIQKYRKDAIDSYFNAISIEPTYIEPYLDLSKVYIDMKMYDVAISYIKQGLKKSFRHYTWLERDDSWGSEPWDLLCIASYYSGDKKNSITYAAKALSYDPSNKRLQDNLKSCLDTTDNNEII